MVPKHYIEEVAAAVRANMFNENGSVKDFLEIRRMFSDNLVSVVDTFTIACDASTQPKEVLDSGRLGVYVSVESQRFDVLIGADLCLVTESELSYAGIEEGADEQR